MSKLILLWLCLLTTVASAQTLAIPGGSGGIPNLPCTTGQIPVRTAAGGWACGTNTSGGAPTSSAYWVSTDDATLSNDVILGALATGFIRNTTTTGIPVIYAGSTPCSPGFVRTINGSGATTCTAVDLAADVGATILPLANGGTGINTTPTDDSVWVANGTGIQSKVIPNCSSIVSSKLLYDATSNSFSCGTDQSNTTNLGNVVGPAGAFPGGIAFWDGPTGTLLTTADRLGGMLPDTQYAPLVDSTGQSILSALSGTGSLVANNTPTILTPFILGFDFANHGHTSGADGGKLNLNTASDGTVLSVVNGGTGQTAANGGGLPVFTSSPVLTGAPQTTDPPANDNDQSIADTFFVQREVHEVGGITSAEINNLIAPGSCANCNLSFNDDGRITAAANGTGGGGGGGIAQIGDCSTATSPCYQNVTQGQFFASPSGGGSGQVTMRFMVEADLPATFDGNHILTGIVGSAISSGTVASARLGSGGNGSNFLRSDGTFATPPGTGTVTNVDMTVPAASILAVTGNPITTTGTLALTTTGTSGGVPYFSSSTQLTSSAQLTQGRLVLGGGAGGAPSVAGAGTVNQVWHGNAGGAGSYSAVALGSADVSGTLGVTNGGTGATTLTNGGVLLGTGTSAVHATAVLTNGQLLIGDGTNDPTVGTLSGTTAEVDITNGAGTIAVGLPNDVTVSNNLSVNNLLTVANQADGSNGIDMFNNTTVMQQGSSGHCNSAFVKGRLSKRCNGDTSGTGGLPYGNVLAEGTAILGVGIVNTGTCGAAQTTAITGLLTTDTILWNPNAAVTAPNGLLTRNVYPTADTLNVVVCNPTAGNLTPGAMTINYKVIR